MKKVKINFLFILILLTPIIIFNVSLNNLVLIKHFFLVRQAYILVRNVKNILVLSSCIFNYCLLLLLLCIFESLSQRAETRSLVYADSVLNFHQPKLVIIYLHSVSKESCL